MSLGTPVFTRINESFTCKNCGQEIPPAESTCRDHCPHCLFSLHVDVNPGDRAANCGGMLEPIAYSQHKKKGYMIHYRCKTCGEERVNRFLEFDAFMPDRFDTLIQLSGITKVR